MAKILMFTERSKYGHKISQKLVSADNHAEIFIKQGHTSLFPMRETLQDIKFAKMLVL